MKASDELRALLDWLRPRSGWHWLVVGEAPIETAQVLLDLASAGRVTCVLEKEHDLAAASSDDRITVNADDFTSLRSVSGVIDATLALSALEHASDPYRVVVAMARATRLSGIVAGITTSSIDRRTLWDWWLDARMNDVSTREFENFSIVRGTR